MRRRAQLTREAEGDLAEAFDYYEAQLSGLGQEFVDSVEHQLERILEIPAQYQVLHSDVRRAVIDVNHQVMHSDLLIEAEEYGMSDPAVISVVRSHQAGLWKLRFSPSGLHAFNRATGLNMLIDEISVPTSLYSRAPRQVSIALTNRCDLTCAHCFAPKSRDELCYDTVTLWLSELDANGTLGVGFGGGEPTLYRKFTELCQHAARETKLSVTFTTHGHHIDRAMADGLRGSVHFIRVSMDGVGDTYESIRRRPFDDLRARLKLVRSISPFGINIVVNNRTVRELNEAAGVAADSGACELLLLPQVQARSVPAITSTTMQELRRWVDEYSGPLKLCINEAHAEGFPTCDPLVEERGLRAYAHIDAAGVIKTSSYKRTGVTVGGGGVLEALDQLVQELAEDGQ